MGEGIDADEADELFQFRFPLKDGHGPFPVGRPFPLKPAVQALIHHLLIERVGGEPVDRREVAGKGKLVIESPEDFYDAERRLDNRL